MRMASRECAFLLRTKAESLLASDHGGPENSGLVFDEGEAPKEVGLLAKVTIGGGHQND
jgi:hypothetical protein